MIQTATQKIKKSITELIGKTRLLKLVNYEKKHQLRLMMLLCLFMFFTTQSTFAATQDPLYNAIYQALIKVEPQVDLASFGQKSDKVFATLDKVIREHPEIYYYDSKKSSYSSDGLYKLGYLFTKDQILATNKQLQQASSDIFKKAIRPNMTEFEKVKAIHDIIVLNTAYDYNNLLKNTVPASSGRIDGLLLRNVAVCDGYAKTMVYLLNQLQIEAVYVTGTADGIPHAWNKVKIDNVWYALDVTWDDPVPDQKNSIRYKYFLIPDSQIAKDHKWENGTLPKATSTKYAFMSDIRNPVLQGGFYYYSSIADMKLYKISTDGKNKTKIVDDRVNELVLFNNWIYFSNYSKGGYLYKVTTAGKDSTKLNDKHVTDLKITNKVFLTYTLGDKPNGKKETIKLDAK